MVNLMKRYISVKTNFALTMAIMLFGLTVTGNAEDKIKKNAEENETEEKETPSRPLLGVSLTPDGPVTIATVLTDGPAAKGGLKAGDVLETFNGKQIEKNEDLLNAIKECKPDQKVELNVLRDEKKMPLTVTLGSMKSHASGGGILNEQAPEWNVGVWDGLSDDKKSLDIADYKGKVVYLYCFQSWCPGCHQRGFPTLKKVQEAFKETDDVAFVTVQTVFEGFKSNTLEKGKEVVREKFDLDIPFGHDMGSDKKRPSIMTGYKTRGTPWTIIIDKQGVVRWNGFHLSETEAVKLIKTLQTTTENAAKTEAKPESEAEAKAEAKAKPEKK